MTAIVNPLGVENGLTYVITGPTGVRAVINDNTDPDFVGYCNLRENGGVTGLERAGVRENADELPEADGRVHGRFLRSGLAFTIQGIIPPDTPAGAPYDSWVGRQARLLAATDAMAADSILSWAPSEAPAVQIAFREQQPTRITGSRPKGFMVAGVSDGSVVYSQALKVASLSPSGAGGGGFVSPLVSPLISQALAVGSLVCTNDGRSKTWPELTIVGPCQNPSIINTNLGLGLYFNATLAAGQTLVVDTDPRRRTVKLDGTSNAYQYLDQTRSVWWPLIGGVNTLQLGFLSYSSPGGLEVRWRDAWG